MIARLCIIIFIYAARGMMWIVEQPVNSLLEYNARFQLILRTFRVWRTAVCQGHFGAKSLKPTWLYSNRKEIADVHLFDRKRGCSADYIKLATTVRKDGKAQVTGNANLKGSQSYTPEFARALHGAWATNQHRIVTDAVEACLQAEKKDLDWSAIFAPLKGTAMWKDAQLEGVLRTLSGC